MYDILHNVKTLPIKFSKRPYLIWSVILSSLNARSLAINIYIAFLEPIKSSR